MSLCLQQVELSCCAVPCHAMLCCAALKAQHTHNPPVGWLTADALFHYRHTADGKVEAVELTQDHRPDLEQTLGSSRLDGEELYWEEGVAYLNRRGVGVGARRFRGWLSPGPWETLT